MPKANGRSRKPRARWPSLAAQQKRPYCPKCGTTRLEVCPANNEDPNDPQYGKEEVYYTFIGYLSVNFKCLVCGFLGKIGSWSLDIGETWRAVNPTLAVSAKLVWVHSP